MVNPNHEVMEALRTLAAEMREWSYAVRVAEALKLPEEYDQSVTAGLAAHGVAVVRKAAERLTPLGLFESNEGLRDDLVEAMKRLSEFADLDARTSDKDTR